MDDPPKPVVLSHDDEENPAFLSAVAAESVNDAILLLDGMQCEAEQHLRRAFAILVDYATSEGPPAGETNALKSSGSAKPTLSSTAIDLLVEQRLTEAEAQQAGMASSRRKGRRRAHVGTFDPIRQRAIMLMIESLSLLDKLGDLDAVTHLQLAIDRAMEGSCQEAESAGGGAKAQRLN